MRIIQPSKLSAHIHPFAIGFAGFSNSGKTTLITRLIAQLADRYRVGYFKHDAHRFVMDHPGKDTWRASEAGAFRVMISSADQQASLARLHLPATQPVCEDCDLLLIEGWKQAPWPKIVLLDAQGQMLAKLRAGELGQVLACVGSEPGGDLGRCLDLPWYHRDDITGLRALIEGHFKAQAALTPLYGLVLAGGQSRRMGQDKAWLDYHGRPQLAVAADLLRAVCAQVFVSARPGQLLPGAAPLIEDRLLGFGPVGGILSAMEAHREAAWLVLACDLPRLEAAALAQLSRGREPLRLATAFVSPFDGLPEPLCAIYEPPMRARLYALLARGRACPRQALIGARIALLQPECPRTLDNVNTPAERARIQPSDFGPQADPINADEVNR